MGDVLAAYPGARRALFRKYHIGGCSSCGFAPEETLGQLCARNGNLSVDEVITHIQASHETDRQAERRFVCSISVRAKSGTPCVWTAPSS